MCRLYCVTYNALLYVYLCEVTMSVLLYILRLVLIWCFFPVPLNIAGCIMIHVVTPISDIYIRPHQISPIQFRQFGSRNHNGKFNARQIIIWFLCTYIQYNSSVKGTTQSENVSNACFCTPLCGFWFWLYLNT